MSYALCIFCFNRERLWAEAPDPPGRSDRLHVTRILHACLRGKSGSEPPLPCTLNSPLCPVPARIGRPLPRSTTASLYSPYKATSISLYLYPACFWREDEVSPTGTMAYLPSLGSYLTLPCFVFCSCRVVLELQQHVSQSTHRSRA